MKKSLTTALKYLVSATFCTALFFACQRSSDFTPADNLLDVTAAKNYYEEFIKTAGTLVPQKFMAGSTESVNHKYINWTQATTFKTDKYSFVEAPLTYDQKVSSLIRQEGEPKDADAERRILDASLNRLMVFKNSATGIVSQYILSYIPNIDYLKKHNYNISIPQPGKLDKDFTGYVKYTTWQGEPVALYKIEEGVTVAQAEYLKENIANSNTSISKYNPITILREIDMKTLDEVVVYASYPAVSYQIIWMGSGGGGMGGGTFRESLPFPAPAGGGGGGGSKTPNANQSIIDSLQGYPCAQEILKELPNCNEATQKILSNIFGVNDKVNVIFKADSTLPITVNGKTTEPSKLRSDGTLTYYVLLNTATIAAAKELTAKTMIHESVHAYINYYWKQYTSKLMDSTAFKAKFPKVWAYKAGNDSQHKEIADQFVDEIQSFVQAYNPSLSAFTAKALAWNGLPNTEGWRNLGADTTKMLDIYQIAKYGTAQQMKALNMIKCN